MPARKSKIETQCKYCGKIFLVLPSRLGILLYCSIICGKLGGNKKRSDWGKLNRTTLTYKQAQSERIIKSWLDEESRSNHLMAMSSPEYILMRSENAKRLVNSETWLQAITEYKNSGEAKRNCAKRKMPELPNWRIYISPNGTKHFFRSAWEESVARYLDILGLLWIYEPSKFILDDGTSYTPDFFVESPFGPCYIECHRLTNIKPGDEGKVEKLHRIARENLLNAPLILLDKPEITSIFKIIGMHY